MTSARSPYSGSSHELVGRNHLRSRPERFWVSLTGRYESGTPLEIDEAEIDELMSRPGAELADFARGRVKPRHQLDAMVAKRLVRSRRVDVGIRFALLNITVRAWAYNFGNPFSGTHFGPGRTATVSLRATLR